MQINAADENDDSHKPAKNGDYILHGVKNFLAASHILRNFLVEMSAARRRVAAVRGAGAGESSLFVRRLSYFKARRDLFVLVFTNALTLKGDIL